MMPEEEMAPEGAGMEAPMEGGGAEQDPLMMLAQGAMQALQSQDCQIAMQVCQGLMALIQQAQGGGAAPQEEGGEPVFARRGAKLQVCRRIKK